MYVPQPLDIVVVEGQWFMPHHWLIKWRTLDCGVHCIIVRDEKGGLYNPIFSGIKTDGKYGNISFYKGRKVTVLRYEQLPTSNKIMEWLEQTTKESEGYDFIGQWLFGFVCGMFTSKLTNDERAWTCAELPYWAFQDNGYELTSRPEVLPMPRLFKYHKDFKVVFEGTL